MKGSLILKVAVITAFTIVTSSVNAKNGHDDDNRTRLECRSDAATEDASIRVRYEQRDDRQKFSFELEAAPGGSYVAGDILHVFVDNELVDSMTLVDLGDIVGEIEFDSTAQADDSDQPFPANFPTVGSGSIVEAGAQLACDLQAR